MHRSRTVRLGTLAAMAAASFATIAAAPADQTFRVNSRLDKVDANVGDGVCKDATGKCTLRAAIQEASALGGHTHVNFASTAKHKLTIPGTGENSGLTGDLDLDGASVTLNGRGVNIDANFLDRAFDVRDSFLELSNVVLVNGDTDSNTGPDEFDEGDGGAIRARGFSGIWVHDSKIRNSSSAGNGGAISIGSPDLAAPEDDNPTGLACGGIQHLDISNSLLEDNTANGSGGAIDVVDANAVISNSQINDNEAGGDGGAMRTSDGCVSMFDMQMDRNTASGSGGAVSSMSDLYMTNVEARNNVSSSHGGAISHAGPTEGSRDFEMRQSHLVDNLAFGGGGGLALWRANGAEITGSEFTQNQAFGEGGGLRITFTDDYSVHDSLFANNMAVGPGGGAHAYESTGIFTQPSFQNNSTELYGGGFEATAGSVTMSFATFTGNTSDGGAADLGGGAICVWSGGTMTMHDSVVQDNHAMNTGGSGGGFMIDGSTLIVSETLISGNTAVRAGGGVELLNGSYASFDGVELHNNDAGAEPGNGGGMHITGAGEILFRNGEVQQNVAANEGGGFWNSSTSTTTVLNTTFGGNLAGTGNDAFNDGGTMTVNGMPIP